MKSSRIKIISVGDIETGKSCLIKRYCEKRFVNKYLPTIGVDFGVTKVTVDDRVLKVNLFDLSGHTAFREVRNEFYKDTQVVLFVYDVTSKSSFENLDSWLNEVKTYISDPLIMNKIIFALCGNKVDKSSRYISFKQGHQWAQQNNCCYFETSAQTGDGVVQVFETVFKMLVQVLETGKRPEVFTQTIGYTKEQVDTINRLKDCKDNYCRLGLTRGATRDDVNKSYRKFAKLLHPDKCDAPGTSEAFKLLSAARDGLLKDF